MASPNPDGSLTLQSIEYGAATGGFEYTRYGIFDTAWDLGWLAEYLWDERNDSAFQNDLFVGSRLAANDVAGSSVLGGVVVDLDHGSLFGSIEASRRLGGSSKLALELRLFSNIDPADTSFSAVRRDDYLQITYSYFL